MMTNSGRLVLPGLPKLRAADGGDVPALADIALGLSRVPRFAGQTTELWTVAEHSMAAARLASDNDMWDRQLELHALLHDAHEACSSDVPTTWKPVELDLWQHDLDDRIYAVYRLPVPSPAQRAAVRTIDRALLLAEAKIFHPRAHARLRVEFKLEAPQAALAAVGYVRALCDGDPEQVYGEFLRQLNRVVAKWEGATDDA